MSQPKVVRCPQCGGPAQWSQDNPFRPFCCERCKMIDLGAWVTEEHRIPGEKLEDEAVWDGDESPEGKVLH